MTDAGGWRVAVDRGGTFTDVVAVGPDGREVVRKVPSADGAIADAVAEFAPLDEVRVGTTVATNALLTRTGARTALLVTAGFGDLLEIGDQTRPDLFALFVRKAAPLCERTVEVGERVLADGTVERPLEEGAMRAALAALKADGIEAVAVALMHGSLHPAHEERVGAWAREAGFAAVALSSEVSPGVGLLARARTAAVDGYVGPIVEGWTARLAEALHAAAEPGARRLARPALRLGAPSGGPPSGRAADAGTRPLARPALRFMKSSGGLSDAAHLRGVDAPLSGPAGGVVACAAIAQELGLEAVLGFDMGGTSTDVCRWAGELERKEELRVAGVRLRTPALDVHTVAAGGGSVLAEVDGRYRAGPASAGADPGPAGYGRGGPATVTDANAVLGRIQAEWFPAVFGEAGEERFDVGASRAALEAVAGAAAGPSAHPPAQAASEASDPAAVAAAGFLAVADATMAAAIAELSTARGHDPAAHTLIAFGGAAGQHACSIARLLGIRHVVVHPRAGVLSAHGIAAARRTAIRVVPVDGAPDEARLAAARADAIAEVGGGSPDVRVVRRYRYAGSETVLDADDRAAFEARHARLFGFGRPDAAVELVALRIEVTAGSVAPPAARRTDTVAAPEASGPAPAQVGFHTSDGGLRWHRTSIFPRESLASGWSVAGPALIPGPVTTVVVDPGWTAAMDDRRILHLRTSPPSAVVADASAPADRAARDPVRLELFWRRFMSIATRMGETLRRVAWSVNIKERLDFSCAVFDAAGHLVTNAPHIPVHLGAMGETVRALAARLDPADLRPGRSWAVNDPAAGGSHLPDITVITPVFRPGAGRPFAWVANRGHHQDVGGVTPGSMPPDSRSLADEGVVFRDVLLVDADGRGPEAPSRFAESEVRARLTAGPHPCRVPDVVVADLRAQVAANTLGVRLLDELAAAEGDDVVAAYMAHVLDVGAETVRAWIARRPPGVRRFEDAMDDGAPVAVSLSVPAVAPVADAGAAAADSPVRPRLVVDFAGTGPASSGNLNAPPAVVRAAVLYVLRTVVGRDIPLNEGCLRAVDLRIPPGSLLDPPPGAAVVGGNVETSQRVVDVLLGALGAAAASQGTMNNLTFGDGTFGYYETLCGGAGAGPDEDGASVVHTHMTNTAMTDPEVLERRCPLIVRETSVRRGSGGRGRHPGGDGLVRRIEARAPVTASLLAQRRTRAPFGLAGAEDGSPGDALLVRPGVAPTPLPPCFTRALDPGDAIEIHTPGGGGYGSDEH